MYGILVFYNLYKILKNISFFKFLLLVCSLVTESFFCEPSILENYERQFLNLVYLNQI